MSLINGGKWGWGRKARCGIHFSDLACRGAMGRVEVVGCHAKYNWEVALDLLVFSLSYSQRLQRLSLRTVFTRLQLRQPRAIDHALTVRRGPFAAVPPAWYTSPSPALQ